MTVPEHDNDLGDWCPYSGTRTADGTCPQFCAEADKITGFDAGDRELPARRGKEEADKRRRKADRAAFAWLRKRNPRWDAERTWLQIARSHVIEDNPGLTSEQVDREVWIRTRPGRKRKAQVMSTRFRPGTEVTFPISKALSGIGVVQAVRGDSAVILRKGRTYRRLVRDLIVTTRKDGTQVLQGRTARHEGAVVGPHVPESSNDREDKP